MEDANCVICLETASYPRMCRHCSKLFCAHCIAHYFEQNQRSPCPHCKQYDNIQNYVKADFVEVLVRRLDQSEEQQKIQAKLLKEVEEDLKEEEKEVKHLKRQIKKLESLLREKERQIKQKDELLQRNEVTEARALTTSTTVDRFSHASNRIPTHLKTLRSLAVQYADQGRYEVAESLSDVVLQDAQKTHGFNHPDVAATLNVKVLLFRDQKKYHDASYLLLDLLQIRERTFGADHMSAAAARNDLAGLYMAEGGNDFLWHGEDQCQRAVKITEKIFGRDHPKVANQLNNLALVCQKLGKYDEMEIHYQRSLNIFLAKLGPDDPKALETMNNLNWAYYMQGKSQQAEMQYRAILTRMRRQEFAWMGM